MLLPTLLLALTPSAAAAAERVPGASSGKFLTVAATAAPANDGYECEIHQ